MDVVGNNIANVNTPGFKGGRVSFKDTLSQTVSGAKAGTETLGGVNPMQIGLGMTIASIDNNFNQGSLQSTAVATDLAIQGDGFFIIGDGTNFFYTRSGVFNVDNYQNFVNAQTGDLTYGWVDTNNDGAINTASDSLEWINLDRRGDGEITNVLSSATTPVQGANEGDASIGPITTFSSTMSDTWTLECIDDSTGEFTVTGSLTGAKGNVFVGNIYNNPDVASFSVNGGSPSQAAGTFNFNSLVVLPPIPPGTPATPSDISLTAAGFGAGGNTITLEMRNTGPNATLSVNVTGNDIIVNLGTDASSNVTSTSTQVVAAINASAAASALAAASTTTPAATDLVTTLTRTVLTGGSGANLGDTFRFTTTAAGDATAINISVNEKGTIIGVFDNGTTEEIAQVALGRFANPQGLTKVGETKFAESPNSGRGFPVLESGKGGTGTILSGFLEMSNVDLSQEFTSMIIIQRGFQANSRIITTGDEMIQELLALKR
jgi:flagellar hook protein FlgE